MTRAATIATLAAATFAAAGCQAQDGGRAVAADAIDYREVVEAPDTCHDASPKPVLRREGAVLIVRRALSAGPPDAICGQAFTPVEVAGTVVVPEDAETVVLEIATPDGMVMSRTVLR